MASRPAPRVPAGPNSLARLAENYQKRQLLQDEMERVLCEPSSVRLGSVENAFNRMTWDAQAAIGRLIMVQEVRTAGDIAITLAMAAIYLDTVLDQMDDSLDKDIVRAVATAIENAVARLYAEGATIELPDTVSDMVKAAGAIAQAEAA